MPEKEKYLLKLADGRNEPIHDLENSLRLVLVDEERVGAEDITFAYCRFEARTSLHRKHTHDHAEEIRNRLALYESRQPFREADMAVTQPAIGAGEAP